MPDPKKNDPQISNVSSEERGSRRGPELVKSEIQKQDEKKKEEEKREEEVRERTLDETLEDSFPASDPLSSIPDPSVDEFDEKKAG